MSDFSGPGTVYTDIDDDLVIWQVEHGDWIQVRNAQHDLHWRTADSLLQPDQEVVETATLRAQRQGAIDWNYFTDSERWENFIVFYQRGIFLKEDPANAAESAGE